MVRRRIARGAKSTLRSSYVEAVVDALHVAFPLQSVDRVLRAVAVHPVPEGTGCLLGAIDLAGEFIPLYDLRRLLGLPPRPPRATDRMLLLGQPVRCAFVVDQVRGTVQPQALEPADALSLDAAGLRGVARAPGGMLLVHDPRSLLALEGAPPMATHAAECEQVVDLLFSSYEEALQANEELRERQDEVQSLNLQLASRAVELEQAVEQLRSFSHTVSHDLRSPLANIAGFSSVLAHKYADRLDAKGLRYLEAIQAESERMKRIVEDVLYLANIDRARVARQQVDLADIAREVMEALQDGQTERRVHFDCVAHAPACCDDRLVRIALENLLGNAWKFTGRQAEPHISFAVRAGPHGEPEYVVADNGAGFDMACAHRLFKPFERLHRGDDFEGFGIGLATVHRIVSLHGGRIRAESAPGQGARFYFSLGAGASVK